MAYAPTYDAYVRASTNSTGGDAGNAEFTGMSREEWDRLTPYQQHMALQNSTGVGAATGATGGFNARGGYAATPEDIARFQAQFGAERNYGGTELNNQALSGYTIGYGDPRYGNLDWNGVAADPSRILWLDPPGTEGRRYMIESGNLNPQAVVQEQSRNNESGLGDGTRWAITGLGTVFGAGLLNNYLTAGNLAGEAGATAAAPGGGVNPGLDAFESQWGNIPAGESLTQGQLDLLATNGGAGGGLTGAAAEGLGGSSLLDRIISAGPQLLQSLPGLTTALGGGHPAARAGASAGGLGSLGGGSAAGGRMGGKLDPELNPYLKQKSGAPVLDLLSYVRGAR